MIHSISDIEPATTHVTGMGKVELCDRYEHVASKKLSVW